MAYFYLFVHPFTSDYVVLKPIRIGKCPLRKETLIEVGKSDELTAKLRGLEKEKRELEKKSTANVQRLVPSISEHWREIVSNLERLGARALPDELETARELLHSLIGEVRIIEEGGHVFGNTALLSIGAGYKSGAQERIGSTIPTLAQSAHKLLKNI